MYMYVYDCICIYIYILPFSKSSTAPLQHLSGPLQHHPSDDDDDDYDDDDDDDGDDDDVLLYEMMMKTFVKLMIDNDRWWNDERRWSCMLDFCSVRFPSRRCGVWWIVGVAGLV